MSPDPKPTTVEQPASAPVVVGRPRPAYAVGAPIALADLLALPPDGNRYGRDERERLVLMAPDDAARHREPILSVATHLARELDPATRRVGSEAPIAFERVYTLAGTILPPSHHGPKALVPDIACFARPIRHVTGPSGHTWYSTEGLLLVVELVSPSSWRADLGDGSSPEEVDRWRTYLEADVLVLGPQRGVRRLRPAAAVGAVPLPRPRARHLVRPARRGAAPLRPGLPRPPSRPRGPRLLEGARRARPRPPLTGLRTCAIAHGQSVLLCWAFPPQAVQPSASASPVFRQTRRPFVVPA